MYIAPHMISEIHLSRSIVACLSKILDLLDPVKYEFWEVLACLYYQTMHTVFLSKLDSIGKDGLHGPMSDKYCNSKSFTLAPDYCVVTGFSQHT